MDSCFLSDLGDYIGWCFTGGCIAPPTPFLLFVYQVSIHFSLPLSSLVPSVFSCPDQVKVSEL